MITPFVYLTHALLQIAASFLVYKELVHNPVKPMRVLLHGFVLISLGFAVAGLTMLFASAPEAWIYSILFAVFSFTIGISYILYSIYLVSGFMALRYMSLANIVIGFATFFYALFFTEFTAHNTDWGIIVFALDPVVRLGILISNSGALLLLGTFFIPRAIRERGIVRTRSTLFVATIFLFAINSGLVYGTESPRIYLISFGVGFLGSITIFWSVHYKQMIAFFPFGAEEWLKPAKQDE